MIFNLNICYACLAISAASCNKKAMPKVGFDNNNTPASLSMKPNPASLHMPDEFFDGKELDVARAISQGMSEQVNFLIGQDKILANSTGKKGMTLLYWAASLQKVECVGLLLSAGAEPNALIRFNGQIFQLLALAAGGNSDELFYKLLKSGADPNSKDGKDPAIFSAIHARRWDRMNSLLDKGADINCVGREGATPLIYLAAINQYEQVANLISRGANINLTNKGGISLAEYVESFAFSPLTENGKWHGRVKSMLQARGLKLQNH